MLSAECVKFLFDLVRSVLPVPGDFPFSGRETFRFFDFRCFRVLFVLFSTFHFLFVLFSTFYFLFFMVFYIFISVNCYKPNPGEVPLMN